MRGPSEGPAGVRGRNMGPRGSQQAPGMKHQRQNPCSDALRLRRCKIAGSCRKRSDRPSSDSSQRIIERLAGTCGCSARMGTPRATKSRKWVPSNFVASITSTPSSTPRLLCSVLVYNTCCSTSTTEVCLSRRGAAPVLLASAGSDREPPWTPLPPTPYRRCQSAKLRECINGTQRMHLVHPGTCTR